jgi:hypothetical protein
VLVAAMAVAACTGSAAAPSATPSATPSVEPTAAVTPSPPAAPTDPAPPSGGAATGPVETAEDAIAAVVALRPVLDGYTPLRAGGEQVIGASATVTAVADEDGFQLVFMTGSGDCPAGCIERRFDAFHVAFDGTVTELCTWRMESGAGAEGTPCVDLAVPAV